MKRDWRAIGFIAGGALCERTRPDRFAGHLHCTAQHSAGRSGLGAPHVTPRSWNFEFETFLQAGRWEIFSRLRQIIMTQYILIIISASLVDEDTAYNTQEVWHGIGLQAGRGRLWIDGDSTTTCHPIARRASFEQILPRLVDFVDRTYRVRNSKEHIPTRGKQFVSANSYVFCCINYTKCHMDRWSWSPRCHVLINGFITEHMIYPLHFKLPSILDFLDTFFSLCI